MRMPLPVLIISVVLFFVLFFGIGFLLNMLFRSSWIMVIIFPIIAIFIVNGAKLIQYFREPGTVFGQMGGKFSALQSADIIILASGLAGAILAGFIIKLLRNKGYQMF
ncbi:Putative membrane protein [Bacillus sp. OV322]|uniref:YuiB family protein n=1 Tax=unclassified Bacillus (in: firmicutes) TaxID=185979 RepID=UPI0008EC796C|nr:MULTISPECIES: YuiB family protein [unclassified Bacillus (in: firmicutes)]OIK13913.1 hypothetical protein BIV59_04415 [Bacillus sp. MUM 13]SFC29405.1 Putative membrane protein [Bacillus sp. OV322]